jgi:hypothetical protein
VREHRFDAGAQDAVRTLVTAVEASWFGDRHPAPGELSAPLHAVRAAVAAGSPVSVRGRLLPHSVLVRTARPGHDDAAAAPRS